MVTWNFINGNISIQEQEVIKEKFLNGLAEFREEFEANNPSVSIDLKADPNTTSFVSFTFADIDHTDFIRRFQMAYPLKEKK